MIQNQSTVLDIDTIVTFHNFYNSLIFSIILTSMIDEPDKSAKEQFLISTTICIFYICELEHIGLL